MRKLAICSAGYALAVLAAIFILPGGALLPLGGFCVILAVLLRLLKRVLPNRNRRRALLFCAGMAAGLLWTWGYGRLFVDPVRQLDGKTVVLTGTVAEVPQPTDYGAKVRIRAQLDSGARTDALLYLDEQYMSLRPGDHISTIAHGTLATHTGDGEEITYYTAKGIFLTATAYGELTWERPERVPLTCVPALLTNSLKQSIDRIFPEDAAALVGAVVTGGRDRLSDSFTSSLQRTGLAHTVAVSGMHLVFLVGLLEALLGRSTRRAVLISLPVIVLFALMTGSTPSVVRAAVMMVLLQLAPLLGRERDGVTSLAFALLVLLIHNPYSIASVGLQLSFGAVAGIQMFSESLQERMLQAIGQKARGKTLWQRLWDRLIFFVISTTATTVGALAFTTPLTAWYFGRVSLIAPLSNLLTLWAVSMVFMGGLTAGVVGIFLPAAAAVLALPVTVLARYLYIVIGGMGKLSFASIPADNPYYLLWLLFVYAVLMLALLLPGRKRLRVPMAAGAMLLAAAVLFTGWNLCVGAMTVGVLDVGQGQSIIIRSGSHVALVDCGGDSYENPGDLAADQIQALGRSQIDLLVISHYHTDHANGVPQLLDRVDVKEIALPDTEEDSPLRQRILQQAQTKNIPVRFIREDTTLTLGQDVEFTIYPPLADDGDTNEQGLTVLCSAGDVDLLVTGDMGSSGEKQLLSYAALPDVELMVAGHHGSKYSNSQLLLGTVRPDVAVFSVGGDNRYGHPTPEAMERFASVGAELYRTDLHGNVMITVEPD